MEPKIDSYPIEIFGTLFNSKQKKDIQYRDNQYCPYLKRECTKPRKSEPHIKVGICSIGYQGFLKRCEASIICPHRFMEKKLFEEIKSHFHPEWEDYRIAPEVSLGVAGSVDYVMFNESNKLDYLCVELQANGTTGSPYGYVKELLINQEYSGKKYVYGLNWANEFSKTMMQQAYKKGNVVSLWGKRIVFVIQDLAMEYLQQNMDTSLLRDDLEDPIHFFTVKMEWNTVSKKYELRGDKWYSGDIASITLILGGASQNKYPLETDFIEAIRRREEYFEGFYSEKNPFEG